MIRNQEQKISITLEKPKNRTCDKLEKWICFGTGYNVPDFYTP
jgi:hypothetical protein